MGKRSQPSRALVEAFDAVRHAFNDLDNAAGVRGLFTAELRALREAVARAGQALGTARGGAS